MAKPHSISGNMATFELTLTSTVWKQMQQPLFSIFTNSSTRKRGSDVKTFHSLTRRKNRNG